MKEEGAVAAVVAVAAYGVVLNEGGVYCLCDP
jgi:hypothetical protein